MRVAIDTNGLFTTQAGVARHIRGLVRGLQTFPELDGSLRQVAWAKENFSYHQPWRSLATAYREFFWNRFMAPGIIRRFKADVFHSTVGYWITPPSNVRCVVTVHDLAVFHFPERFRRWQSYSGRRSLRLSAKADRIICISQFTADDLIRGLGISPKKIDVVPNGCDFHPSEPAPAEMPPEIPVPKSFFLFVGSLEPGKNLSLLRLAYQNAEAQRKPLLPLVIVGARWEGVPGEGPPPHGWIYLGRQPDSALVHLYRRATALVFPSKFEGFGLPVAESMALGCPVICSPVSSLPEVAGEAAYLVDQTPEAYQDAMGILQCDNRVRAELILRGHAQAARFSWRRCAEQTLEVYRASLRN